MKPTAQIKVYGRRPLTHWQGVLRLPDETEYLAVWEGGLFAEVNGDLSNNKGISVKMYQPFHFHGLILTPIAPCYSTFRHRDSVICVQENFTGFLIMLFYRFVFSWFGWFLARWEKRILGERFGYKDGEMFPKFSPASIWFKIFGFVV